MPYFNIVAQTNENTVVTEYEPVKSRSDNYQSEAALEREFIKMLTEQGYEYLKINILSFGVNNSNILSCLIIFKSSVFSSTFAL